MTRTKLINWLSVKFLIWIESEKGNKKCFFYLLIITHQSSIINGLCILKLVIVRPPPTVSFKIKMLTNFFFYKRFDKPSQLFIPFNTSFFCVKLKSLWSSKFLEITLSNTTKALFSLWQKDPFNIDTEK